MSRICHNIEPYFLEAIKKRAGVAAICADEENDRQLSELVGDVHHLLAAVGELKEDLGMADRLHHNCPVCGWRDVRMRYCDGCTLRAGTHRSTSALDTCMDGDPEHFHRRCMRCEYSWRTDDIPDAQIRCAETIRGMEA